MTVGRRSRASARSPPRGRARRRACRSGTRASRAVPARRAGAYALGDERGVRRQRPPGAQPAAGERDAGDRDRRALAGAEDVGLQLVRAAGRDAAAVTTAAALTPPAWTRPPGARPPCRRAAPAEQKRRRGEDAQAAAVVLERRPKRAAAPHEATCRSALTGARRLASCARSRSARTSSQSAPRAAAARVSVSRARRTRLRLAPGVMPSSAATCSCVRPSISRRSRAWRWLSGRSATSASVVVSRSRRSSRAVDALDARRLVAGVQQVQGDRVGARPRDLVQAAVAHEAEEVGPDLDVAVVAAQRAVRAQQRLLHDVVDDRRPGAQDLRA